MAAGGDYCVLTDISVPDAILRGVRNMPDARALVARLGTKTTIFERTDNKVDDLQQTVKKFANA